MYTSDINMSSYFDNIQYSGQLSSKKLLFCEKKLWKQYRIVCGTNNDQNLACTPCQGHVFGSAPGVKKAFLRCSNHENFKAGFNSQSIRNIAKCRDNDISLRSMWLANRAVTILLTNRSARTDNYNDDHSGISYKGNGKCLSWPFL